jgi:hypothetical protein
VSWRQPYDTNGILSKYELIYENLIDDKKEKLWDAMLYAMQNYQ